MHFFIILFFFVIAFSQGKIDGVVAIVGNNIVLHSDVFQQTQIFAASRGVDPTTKPYLFEKIYSQTLDDIVNQYAVLDIAEKDTNLIVSDDEVDRALERRIDEFIAQAGSKTLFEEAVGMSLRQIKLDYWHEIRNMMFIEKYKFSTIQTMDVSRVEVNNFYKNYKDSIPSVPENYTFSVVEVPFYPGESSEKEIYTFVDSLRSLVVLGTMSFDSLAKVHSKDPGSSSSGGHLGFTSRGTLVQEYEEAAFSLKPGELSPPIRSKFGYHLIKLLNKRGEEISSQHVLVLVPFSDEDKNISLKRALSIYNQSYNDPFVFDSLSISYNNNYNNFSGKYSMFNPSEIPFVVLDLLKNQTLFQLSSPIEIESGYILIYLYKHEASYMPNLKNSWNLIYQYAKHEKENRAFNNLITKIKQKTYIKKFYE